MSAEQAFVAQSRPVLDLLNDLDEIFTGLRFEHSRHGYHCKFRVQRAIEITECAFPGKRLLFLLFGEKLL